MSSIDEAENVYDLSGQGRTLAPQTNPSFGTEALTPYLLLNGSHYLDRADEAGLDITGALTLGGWFYFDTLAVTEGLISKYKTTGDQRSFTLVKVSDGSLRFPVSSDGLGGPGSLFQVILSDELTAGAWFFCVGRYTPGVEIKVWVNSVTAEETSSIPSSIYSSTSPLELGNYIGNILDGRIALPFICAHALPDAAIAHLYQATRTLFAR